MYYLKYLILLITSISFAQSKFTITGKFNLISNKAVILTGFYVDKMVPLDKSTTDAHGNFTFTYPKEYSGAAIIDIDNSKKVLLVLNQENFKIDWKDSNDISTLKFINSPENAMLDSGLLLYHNTENKKSGISYLIPHYNDDLKKQQFFLDELYFLNSKTAQFLESLSNESYVKYYLNIRILIADLPLYSTRYFDRLPELERKFNALNFTDSRLIQSGLYYQLIEEYVIAMETYGDQQYIHLNNSIDAMLISLKKQPILAQDVTEKLFNLLEKRSLFKASEHLALAMLSDENCQLDDKHKALFEQYRKMSNGKIAPNIVFANSTNSAKQLSDIKANYKLVVFGASWCPKCSEDIPQLISYYKKWKEDSKLEIVFISLDTEKSEFSTFVKDFPWISSADFKGWETKAAIHYSVFGTPTMYLLDKDHKILLKPISADQIETWLKYQ